LDRKELMTAAQAAKLLHVSQKTILKWAREGKLEPVKLSNKIVLFEQESIDTFLLSKTNKVESIKQTGQLSKRKDSLKSFRKRDDKQVQGKCGKAFARRFIHGSKKNRRKVLHFFQLERE
jgi:excisionase family DNA binding protein